MIDYKFYLYAAVRTAVAASPLYFVDTTVLVKALVVSTLFGLIAASMAMRQVTQCFADLDKINKSLNYLVKCLNDQAK